MPNQLGKLYICAKCGAQVIVTKGGNGEVQCCGAPMEQKKWSPEKRMARLRFLEGREAGILARLVQRIFRAAVGRELNPYKIVARSSSVLLSYFLSNTLLLRGRLVLSQPLRSLARIRVAARNGCVFWMDINAAVGGQAGLAKEKIEAAFGTGDASALDPRERLVVEYADRVTATPVDVPDAFFEALRAAFSEREIVELTATIAHESFNSKFNRALRIEANEFCSLRLPSEPPAPIS